MDWADYLRDQATQYRRLAEKAEDPLIKQELLDLAATCEEVANDIEDRQPGGQLQLHPALQNRFAIWLAAVVAL
jgi:hypothetical protein